LAKDKFYENGKKSHDISAAAEISCRKRKKERPRVLAAQVITFIKRLGKMIHA